MTEHITLAFSAVTEDLARNGEITVLAFMKLREKNTGARHIATLLQSLLQLKVMFLITAVLGDFAAMTDYPFLTVGAYAGVDLFSDLIQFTWLYGQ